MRDVLKRGHLLLLPLISLAGMVAVLPAVPEGPDMAHFALWMDSVRAGGVSSLSGEFAIYSPTYIYLLYLFSWLVPVVGTGPAIKLISLPFLLLLSVALHGIVLAATASRTKALAAAALIWVLPTLFINAFYWGQADVIYVSVLAWCTLFAMKDRPALAAAAFGIALSLKLQAMFLSPMILYLVLARRMRLRHLLLVPAAYAAMMVPAMLAGRPVWECLTLYFQQYEFVTTLSANAPNPWRFAKKFIALEWGIVIGLAAGAAAGLAIALGSLRLRPGPVTILLVATVSAAALPYVLPKMHDRFFFPADVLSLALAFALTRRWLAGALIQLGSLLAYMSYLKVTPLGSVVGVVPMSFGVGLLALAFIEAQRGSGTSWRDVLAALTGKPAPIALTAASAESRPTSSDPA